MKLKGITKKEIKERIHDLSQSQKEEFNPYRQKNLNELKEKLDEK